MRDQADELRSLVLKSLRQNSADLGPQPRLILVTGGKGGVGATTLAVNLSVAMAQHGLRVVLVDANLYRADVAMMCGLSGETSVLDVLAGNYDIHEVLQRGPAGIQVAPGKWASDRSHWVPESALLRLVRQLKTLGRHADVVIIDAGIESSDARRAFWEAASDVILVTTPDPVSVMDSYATLKLLMSQDHAPAIRIVVNRTASKEIASDVHQRISQSCQRFLGLQIGSFDFVPHADEAADASLPLLIRSPSCDASKQIQRIANEVALTALDAGFKTTRIAA